jgi:DNA-entry nuclease
MKWSVGFTIFLFSLLVIFRVQIFDSMFNTVGQMESKPTLASDEDRTELDKLLAGEPADLKPTILNGGKPNFNEEDLKIDEEGWQKLSSLDWMGRPGKGDALLSKKLMPPSQNEVPRERLTIKTPGYKVYQMSNGKYLYNRSHIISYQLTGLNDERKNLFTGTVQLNTNYAGNPNVPMQYYETEVAQYLKQHPTDFVRYRVIPIYKNIERVPRGVTMEAQSIYTNEIMFNVFIPNIQMGYNINYLAGYVSQAAA